MMHSPTDIKGLNVSAIHQISFYFFLLVPGLSVEMFYYMQIFIQNTFFMTLVYMAAKSKKNVAR